MLVIEAGIGHGYSGRNRSRYTPWPILVILSI